MISHAALCAAWQTEITGLTMANPKFVLLHRYWIEFDRPAKDDAGILLTSWPPSACGVNACSRADALAVLEEVAEAWRRPFPTISRITEDVDVSTLPVRVAMAMDPHIGRGMWYWGWPELNTNKS